MKMKKGWLAVEVGLEDEDGGSQRFSIPISNLYHPLFQSLLDKARETYGYNTNGPLRLPCSVEDFHNVRWRIERENGGSSRRHQRSQFPTGSLSFHSC